MGDGSSVLHDGTGATGGMIRNQARAGLRRSCGAPGVPADAVESGSREVELDLAKPGLPGFRILERRAQDQTSACAGRTSAELLSARYAACSSVR